MPTPRGTMYGSLGGTSSTRERASERQARGCSWSQTDSYSTFQPAWLKIDAAAYGSSAARRGASIRVTPRHNAVPLLLTFPQMPDFVVSRGGQFGTVTQSCPPDRAERQGQRREGQDRVKCPGSRP